MISIPFRFDTPQGVFSDALVLTEQELAELSDDQLQAMKQQRLDNWLVAITDPGQE
jgi:hypothetical protein